MAERNARRDCYLPNQPNPNKFRFMSTSYIPRRMPQVPQELVKIKSTWGRVKKSNYFGTLDRKWTNLATNIHLFQIVIDNVIS